jgi:hypothetical protein
MPLIFYVKIISRSSESYCVKCYINARRVAGDKGLADDVDFVPHGRDASFCHRKPKDTTPASGERRVVEISKPRRRPRC